MRNALRTPSKRGTIVLVPKRDPVQTDEMVKVEFRLPRSARDRLDAKAVETGMSRATKVRSVVLRDLRESDTT